MRGVVEMIGNYNQIMVPVDGSLPSIDAFKKAVHIVKRNQVQLHLVTVIEKTRDTEEADYQKRNKAELLTALENYAQKENVSITKDIRIGNPKEVIADELVKEWDIDLIVMGATGKGRVAKMVLGSVTNHVTRYTTCDVLIVK